MFDFVMLFPLTLLIGGLVIAALAMNHRARLRELAYRERIAMIERGLAPAPETDPMRFERAMDRWVSPDAFGRLAGHRYRSFGIVVLGLALALLMLITFAAGEPGVGFGVGGAIACLGLAFLLNGMLEARAQQDSRHDAPPRPPQGPTQP